MEICYSRARQVGEKVGRRSQGCKKKPMLKTSIYTVERDGWMDRRTDDGPKDIACLFVWNQEKSSCLNLNLWIVWCSKEDPLIL